MSDLRTEVRDKALTSKHNNIIFELATGTGKTKLALDTLHSLYTPTSKILIVIPRLVLIDNWKEEFRKWAYNDMLQSVSFTTYVSLPKHKGQWDIVIFDEAHHLSDRCQYALRSYTIKHCIFLSATLKKEHKDFIHYYCKKDLEYISVSTKKAIVREVLAEPEVILVPLELDNKRQDIILVKHGPKKGEKPLIVPYEKKWDYRKYKGALSFRCTQRQYYYEMSSLIDWYKKKNYIPQMKTIWLHKCGVRLQWLSMMKILYTRKIIQHLPSRFVVFCNSIAESQAFHIPVVNSKSGTYNLTKFNNKEIDSMAAVNILNEGLNLVDCKIGVFNAINSSEVLQVQKLGRILRHDSPTIIIPYFKDTREEEIVKKWLEGFNKNMIKYRTLKEICAIQ